jgi:hypothetical protein
VKRQGNAGRTRLPNVRVLLELRGAVKEPAFQIARQPPGQREADDRAGGAGPEGVAREEADVAYAAFNTRLFRFLVRLSRRRDVAEDLLEETWLRLVKQAGQRHHRAGARQRAVRASRVAALALAGLLSAIYLAAVLSQALSVRGGL